MTTGAIDALHADREAILELGTGLTEAEWAAASGCPGWSAKDVLAHMGALLRLVIDPASLPDATGLGPSGLRRCTSRSRRSWSAARVLADYEWVSLPAFEALEGLAGLDLEVPLGDLGTYPAALIPAAYAFDHYTHIRADLFPPRGPLPGPPPPSDELRLVPALDWIEAALPQQNAGRPGRADRRGADQRDRAGREDHPGRPGRAGRRGQLRRPRAGALDHPAGRLGAAGREALRGPAPAGPGGPAEGVLTSRPGEVAGIGHLAAPGWP